MKKRAFLQASAFLIIIFLIAVISAEKLSIQVGDSYTPGEEIKFKITLYDDQTNPLKGEINYEIKDFLTETIHQGTANSGQETTLTLPLNMKQGYAAIIAEYNNIKLQVLFNVMELEKVDIKLKGDNLIISNKGNTDVLAKEISISIGEHYETVLVTLAVGQTKTIRLTAPPGEYTIKVSDRTEENTFEVQGVSLTGNVIGLEKLKEKSFWEEYPLVILFLFSIITIALIVVGLRFQDKFK